MHGFKSARERLAAPGYADGGIIGWGKRALGLTPPETISEKFKRQDAERAAKRPAAPASAPDLAMTPARPQIGGMNMGATERRLREAEQGLADGGSVRAKLIRGPGTSTSDSIPAKKPAGTVILPADTTEQMVDVKLSKGESEFPPEVVQRVGAAALLAARDATHVPAEPGLGFQPQPRAQQFADGGMVEDERQRRINQIPTGGMTAPAGEPVTGTELSRNVANALAAVPGAGPAMGAQRAMLGASRFFDPATRAVSSGIGAAMPYAVPAAGAAGLMAASSSPAAPPTPVPAQSAAVTMARPATSTSTAQAPQPGQPGPNPENKQIMGTLSNNIVRQGNSYSSGDGGPITAGATINGREVDRVTVLPSAREALSRPTETFLPAGFQPQQYQLTAADRLGFNGAMRMTPTMYADKYGRQALDQRLSQEQAAINAERGDATTRAGQDARTAIERSGQAITAQDNLARQQLGVGRFGLDSQAAAVDARAKLRRGAAEDAYLNAKTPEERSTALAQLQALQGATPASPWKVQVTPTTKNVDGSTSEGSIVRYNAQTGQVERVESGVQAAPLPPGMKRQVGTYQGKPVYEDASGNRFTGG